MAPQKETLMVLKVDLGCHRCYTKVKRLLCCYPQIMDQIYNEKQNTVTIKVVCCSPEKIMDKLLSRGGKSIKGIQILEPPKKPAPDQPKQAPPPPAEKPPKEAPADKPPKAAPPPADAPEKLKKNGSKNASKNGGGGGGAADAKPPGDAKPPKDAKPPGGGDAKPPGDAAKPPGGEAKPPGGEAKPPGDAKPKDAAPAPKPADQAAAMMQMMAPERVQYYPGYPVNAGCMECYDGRMCYHGNGYGGFGAPPPPPPPAGGWGYYGPPPPGGYGYGYKPVHQYGDYVSDENATGCVVM